MDTTTHVTADQMPGTDERPGWAVPGAPIAGAQLLVTALGAVLLFTGAPVAGIVLSVLAPLPAAGLIVVQPNETKVLIVFGRYTGTVRREGLSFVNPLSVFWRKTVSLRVRNFQTERSKANDAGGSPIIIAAVIVWKVVHTELQARLAGAGIEVLETRLTHLAYAPEIAEAMLRRQQATAIVAARHTIVEGAVGLVDMALERISAKHIVELDEERKAAMVSNLMVVLTGDRSPTPVINTGTLYGS